MCLIDNEIRKKLESCKDIFPQIGKECLIAFSDLRSEIDKPWDILERLTGDYLHNIILGTGNNMYQAIFGIGFKTDHDMEIIQSFSFEELTDIWGELANTYCGMLMDRKIFTDSFGILTQSNPQYSSGEVYYSKAYAVCGALVLSKGKKVYFGYAIRKLIV